MGLVPLAVFVGFRDLTDKGPLAMWLPRVAGLVLVVAGLYQLTPWKKICR